ncbi:MAG: tRNA dihydrouridine synthase DusB [Magnetococcales bacterium]|nr:tRNA dihydrouridine synthase DusB [Magnetococcales bacterium]
MQPENLQIDNPIVNLFSQKKNGLGAVPLILAPMAGVTDLPFRNLAHHYGAALTVSEMVASQAMIRETPQSLKIAANPENMGLNAVQIAGSDPEVMAQAAKMNVALGARIIDINMGCPVKKIVKNGAGSALLRDEELIGRILSEVIASVDVPVTIKIRLGWDEDNLNSVSVARLGESLGVSCVTVHGRTKAQMYRGVADWDAIGRVKSSVSIPVIGNGDITTPQLAKEMLERSGVDGIMVGRGSYGKPWIFKQILEFLTTGEDNFTPDIMELEQLVTNHFKSMIQFYGELIGNRMARKHLAWYTKGMVGGAQFRKEINQSPDPEATLAKTLAFFRSQRQLRAA